MTYAEKLKHPLWQAKRLRVLERDKFTCCACDDKETTLHIHHLRYTKTDPHEEPTVNLVTLCEHCHKTIESYKKLNKKVNSIRKLKYEAGGGVVMMIKCDDGNLYFDSIINGKITQMFGVTQFRFFSLSEYFKQ